MTTLHRLDFIPIGYLGQRFSSALLYTSLYHTLSGVSRPSVHPSLFTFHIFDFSSETAEQNSTKLYKKQDLNVFSILCYFLLEDVHVLIYYDHLEHLSSRESIYITSFLSVRLRYFYTVLEILGKASVWLSTIELVFKSVFNIKKIG